MVKLRDDDDSPEPAEKGERLASLDAMRGLVLLLIVGHGFGLRQMLDPQRWSWITNQLAQREWQGCTLWDLLQPAMLFLVGVAMPYSYANREASGQNWIRQFAHAIKRAGLLILLGVYLDSWNAQRLVFDLRGDLQQIGLAYFLAFLVLPLGMPAQGVTVAFLLIGHTAAHVIHAFAGGHELWLPDRNVGIVIDQWLHLGPHSHHYTTFNAVSNAAIVLLGVLIGNVIRGGLTSGAKVAVLAACSVVGLLFGWFLSGGNGFIELSWVAIIPMIQRLGTWTFVFMAVGWTLLAFTYFYLIIDGFKLISLATPLAVFGRNALFLFIAFSLFRPWAERNALLVLPTEPATIQRLGPLFVELMIVLTFWLICLWLYCRRIFFKV
ncbi:MAG: hypothetical protein FJ303_16530 [Planctomycetes bacterium]|nr:hypothetical protein [Planctomycetota bacterium]